MGELSKVSFLWRAGNLSPGSVQPSETLLTEELFWLDLGYALLNIQLKAQGNLSAYFRSSFILQLLQYPAPQVPAVSATQIDHSGDSDFKKEIWGKLEIIRRTKMSLLWTVEL